MKIESKYLRKIEKKNFWEKLFWEKKFHNLKFREKRYWFRRDIDLLIFLPFDINKFVGFISLCINRFECKKARPETISKAYLLIMGSASGPKK